MRVLKKIPCPLPGEHGVQQQAANLAFRFVETQCALAAVGAIGVASLQAQGSLAAQGRYHGGGIAVLNTGSVTRHRQQRTQRIEHQMALRPLTFLPASNPVSPPWAIVCVLWASLMAAIGALLTRARRS
jgi:hypothetical protein